MEIDPKSMSAVTRAVETAERDGRPAKVVVATRRYPTSIEDLWDALTTIERIPRWFLPITGDLRLGGRYQLEGNAGGEIVRCEPPRRFEITWEYGGDVSWVAVELREADVGNATELELRHIAHVPDELWDQFGPGAVGLGWDMGLMGLDLHIATGFSRDRAEVEAWQSSPNYREVIGVASDAWRDASIADGTDERSATAAAERVAAAYTATE
jgi:uncharacterized protein YndB with AHSA1/START domain